MGENTKIEWADHTASPWHGCSEVHLGCDNCYARELSKRNPATLGVWGDEGTRVKSKSFIRNLRKWDREAREQGRIVSVFPSLCDPFEDRPELEPWRHEMFEAIDQCPSVRLLLLTKRPQNVRGMWPGACRPNVHLYYSASDQPSLEAGIDALLACRDLTPVLGLSLEPLVGPVDIFAAWGDAIRREGGNSGQTIDWVIVGGESGPGARPMHPGWVRSIRDQCVAAGVPFFFKQWGEWAEAQINTPEEWAAMKDQTWTWLDRNGESGFAFGTEDRACMSHVGKAKAGRLLDGREWNEFPEVSA